MGEPAVPTDAERAETLATARSIVDSVRNDERMPWPVRICRDLEDSIDRQSALELLAFRLAQDLVDETERHTALRAELVRLHQRWTAERAGWINDENGQASADRIVAEGVFALLNAEGAGGS